MATLGRGDEEEVVPVPAPKVMAAPVRTLAPPLYAGAVQGRAGAEGSTSIPETPLVASAHPVATPGAVPAEDHGNTQGLLPLQQGDNRVTPIEIPQEQPEAQSPPSVKKSCLSYI